ncbi:EAL domain-containing protein [bacterium]|nr:EAL domain-containing protein [bacterium]
MPRISPENNKRLLELFLTQSREGVFLLTFDPPLNWAQAKNKARALESAIERHRLARANDVLLLRLGLNAGEVESLHLKDLLPPDEWSRTEFWHELFDQGSRRFHWATGTELPGQPAGLEGECFCLYEAGGLISGVCGIIREDAAPDARKTSPGEIESLYRLLSENTTDLISRHSDEGVFLYLSPACENLLGYCPEELLGDSIYNYFHPDDLNTVIRAHSNILRKSEHYTIRYRIRHKDGHYAWFETTNRTIRDPKSGKTREIIAVSRDISDRVLVETRLRESENLSRTMLDATTDSAFLFDTRAVCLAVNNIGASRLNRKPEEIVGRSMADLFPSPVYEFRQKIFDSVISRRESMRVQDERQGFHFDTFYSPILDDQGEVTMVALFAQDITERVGYEQKLKLFEKVFENTLEGILITDSAANILAVNASFQTITGYSSEEVTGRNPSLLRSDRHDAEFFSRMWNSLLQSGYWSGEIWNRRKSGEAYPEWLSISAIRDRHDKPVQYVAVFHDITEVKHKEEQIRIQAYYDALTGLPNRSLLKDRLSVAISHAQRTRQKLAVIFIDLDNFKHVNDSLGHQAGDQLLLGVADRLRRLTRREDTVSRLSGDEFLVVMTELTDERYALLAVERILEEFQKPFRISDHELLVTTSIGIAFFPEDSTEPEDLIRCADIAMYQAKKQGKNNFRLFTNEMNEKVIQRLSREENLRRALDQDELRVYFQPRLNAASGKVGGMEALSRWVKPDGQVIGPENYISLAEETGLILPLGERVIELACQETMKLAAAGYPDLRLGVNLSPRQFSQKKILEKIKDILARTSFPPTRLVVEITESTLFEDVERTNNLLVELSELGVSLAVDDFGTGYSSLNRLKRLPIDELKVDRSFVMDLEQDPDDACIVRTIINMAKGLRMRVTAEGVETPGQLDFLVKSGCDEVQGFLFGRPMPPEKFFAYLREKDAQAR